MMKIGENMMGKLSRNIKIQLFVLLSLFVLCLLSEASELEYSGKSLSVFPFLIYDTDIGWGYGAKAKFVNYLTVKESFDLLLFGSTKGERLFDFIFSIPDIEIRQGKTYSLSFDINAKYNRIKIDNFFGIGPDSSVDDLTHLTNEKKELKLTLGRGFNSFFVCQASYYFRNIHYYDIEENKAHTKELKCVGEQFSPFLSLLVRYDTSDSQIHPTRGLRLEVQTDLAYGFLGNTNASYARLILDLRKYLLVFGQKDVLAFRIRFQKISGDEIPLFELSVLGGGSTENVMRGYAMNRFQDKGKILINTEYRFPIWKRLGGNVFVDLGTVWPSLKKINFRNPAINIGWGLRYYLKNFLARFDMGFSKEDTRIFFQFNHIF
jgi:outer membrane protein assembly factor BamA